MEALPAMFETISRLFGQSEAASAHPLEPRLAVAAILVHLAAVDGQAKPEEYAVIANALKDHYGLGDADVKKLVTEAKRKNSEAVDFYKFTSTLSKLDENERVAIVRMMWQVVFVDGANHELEDNMVWRVAELIGVSARDRTILRNQTRRGAAPLTENDD